MNEILDCLLRGARKAAQRERTSPLDRRRWPGYPGLLVQRYGEGAGLVLALADDLGAQVRLAGGVPILVIGDERPPMRVPSEAAADWLTEVVHFYCDVLPTDHGIRRAMRVLAERARRAA